MEQQDPTTQQPPVPSSAASETPRKDQAEQIVRTAQTPRNTPFSAIGAYELGRFFANQISNADEIAAQQRVQAIRDPDLI
ncbi:MAG: hypothetical protein HC876_11870 [Chloroflexaceae bacterium]|nr:hypothetical protein [Chloroflexaceae bacterium]NJO06150.1 hypothetical protein [Chloroflexaceae bacterium]